ncbi:unnamed protein product [Citrullus colocynthis]|uniref:TF-B3 domain-containing protein n=1 Tax=Citrullus colocynthis TaxID=252529 RepID=A0ABP0XY37_9ROSI
MAFGRKRRKRKNEAVDDKPKKEIRREVVFSTTIEMPSSLRDRIVQIGGYDIHIVIQKRLQDIDVDEDHNQFSIPIEKLESNFATKFEEQKNKGNEMEVLIIDSCLRESVICLKKFKIARYEFYCLTSEWNYVVQNNSLESGDFIQLWSFRKNRIDSANETGISHHLCFALVKLDISEGIFKFV